MRVHFYNFKKRVNSTKQPSKTSGRILYNVVLKTPSTVDSPVIEVSATEGVIGYNYCYIEEFDHFYFVKKTEVKTNSLTLFYLDQDTLATFKNEILSSTQFVTRSASDGYSYIRDAVTPPGVPYVRSLLATYPLINRTGMYVIGVIGKGASITGGVVNYFGMDQVDFNALMSFLFTTSNYSQEITDEIVKTYFNPFQYIVSCKWFPMLLGGGVGANAYRSKIQFGWWDNNKIKGVPLLDATYDMVDDDFTINKPFEDFVDFRNYEPFNRYTLHVPYIGDMNLPSGQVLQNDETAIHVHLNVDVATGAMTCKVTNATVRDTTDSRRLIAIASGQCAADVPLAQMAVNYSSVASSMISRSMGVLGALPEAVASGNPLGSISNALNGTSDTLYAPELSVMNSAGERSIAQVDQRVNLYRDFVRYAPPLAEELMGKPCMRQRALENLSGFTVCNNASVSLSTGSEDDVIKVNNFLNGGFFIE